MIDNDLRTSLGRNIPSPQIVHSRVAEYEVEVVEDVRIPSSVAGLTLGADLYRPRTERPVPALVTLHSARRDGIGGIGARRYLRYFAERGYAALYVDCFGIGTSEGVPRPILSPGEVDDGVSVVEWAAGQQWCSGSVGMWGLSHGGMTTLAVASRRPPHLRAIFPVMGWTDAERDLVHPDGLRGGIGLFGHLSLYNIFCALLPPIRSGDRAEYERVWKERLDEFEPWFVDAWKHDPGHEVWGHRRLDPSAINVPALCVTGWRDLFCDAMIRAYDQIQAPKKLLVGPWLHSFPDASSAEPFPAIALACEWWDRWLHTRSPETESQARATIYLQGMDSRWVQTEQWPPSHTRSHVLAATGSGRLAPCLDAPDMTGPSRGEERRLTSVSHASDLTVGALSGLVKHPIDRFGYPLDQHDDDSRSLSFTSAPIAKPMVIAGRPTARIAFDGETTASSCVIKVTDVDESNRSVLITTGVANLIEPQPNQRGSQKVVPVDLDPTCYCVPAGHRVRLVLAESDFPRLWPPDSPGQLSVRVMQEFGGDTGNASIGIAPATASVISLPVCDPAELVDVTVEPSARDTPRRSDVDLPPDRWEITRDHRRGTVGMTVQKTDGARYTSELDRFLIMNTRIHSEINNDPSSAVMMASGEKSVEIEDGEHILVKSSIEMRQFEAEISAEIVMNDVVIFSKEWKFP